MNERAQTADAKKYHFHEESRAGVAELKKPFAEKLLVRFPRIASLLAAAGATGLPRRNGRSGGRLAAMMTASGSIDPAGKPQSCYRFYIRPMS